ncbi:MAG: NUDIX domain-containing protein [Adhaeribacter sp.]
MKEINKQTVYDGFFKLYKITYEDDGETFDREVFVTGNAVAALLYDTQKDKFIFVKQFRPAVNQDMLELVAGLLDKEGESPEDTMIREIEEESGYAVDKLEMVVNFYPSPGAFAEKLHVYYAEVSHKIGEGGGADGENEKIKLIELTKVELKDKIFNDAKTLIAVQWAKLKGII